MPAAQKPVKCPECGKRATYSHAQQQTRFFRCSSHGVLVVAPDGRVRVDDPKNSAVRH